MQTKRTDTHAPSSFDPAEYLEVGYFDNHPEEGGCWIDEDVADREAFTGNYETRGRCDHCGAGPLRYGVVFLHNPSDRLVVVGTICAGRLNLGSRSDWERKQSLKQARRERVRRNWIEESPRNAEAVAYFDEVERDYRADQAVLDAWNAEVEREWSQWYSTSSDADHFRPSTPRPRPTRPYDTFVNDLIHKLNRYGSLSEKQVEAALRSRDREQERAAKRAAEAATAKPFREGRREVEGVVQSTKFVDNDFGGTLKMLVDEGDGNRVWGTVPQSLPSDPVGARIRFKATVEQSRDDAHFGFFKRPTGATVVE